MLAHSPPWARSASRESAVCGTSGKRAPLATRTRSDTPPAVGRDGGADVPPAVPPEGLACDRGATTAKAGPRANCKVTPDGEPLPPLAWPDGPTAVADQTGRLAAATAAAEPRPALSTQRRPTGVVSSSCSSEARSLSRCSGSSLIIVLQKAHRDRS